MTHFATRDKDSPHDGEHVVVVGSGVAGLSAAVEAAEAGAEVLVLERGDAIGGASVMSAASTSMVGTPLQHAHGIDDDVELALADWIRMGGPTADVEWARRYLERSRADVYEWCADLGIKWMALSQPEGNSVPRVHTPSGFGRGIVDALAVRALGAPALDFRRDHAGNHDQPNQAEQKNRKP